MRHWLDTQPESHGWIERINNVYPVQHAPPGRRTLEIGAGIGAHLRHENLERQEYYAVELRDEFLEPIRNEFPSVNAIAADCQERLPFADGFFDRALAIHVLEHLPDLPAALDEIYRVLSDGGHFAVVIPCEGGIAYGTRRRLTVQRQFERRYGVSYDWHIKSEHLSVPGEILTEPPASIRNRGPDVLPAANPVGSLERADRNHCT